MAGPTFANEWICLQPGARERYATPRAMLRHARLQLMLTEFWAGPSLRRLPGPFRLPAGRFHPEIPAQLVRSFNWRTALGSLGDLLRPPRDVRERSLGHMAQHAALARWVVKVLCDVPLDPSRSVYFTYKTTADAPLRWMKERGIVTVYEMYDPGRAEEQIVIEESQRWPGWSRLPGRIPDEYHQRVREAMLLSDVIVGCSEWTMRHLADYGVPASRMVVAPLVYEGMVQPPDRPKRLDGNRKLRVLWVGQVILRKGFPYLVEAAKLLAGERVEICVVGSHGISENILKSVPPNMRILDAVPHAETSRFYRESDVFILPTLSDGFGITQLEAMAHGLPVIATPNCGQVVTDGQDGFIIPIRDPQAIADRIMAYVNDPQLLPRHSQAAPAKVGQFTLERYARDLNTAVDRFRATGSAR